MVKLNSLVKNQPYLITHVDHCNTQDGPTVLLTIKKSENSLKKVFLPQHYSNVMTDEDLANINSKTKQLNLLYKGMCSQTKGYLLAITGEEDII
jgi:hypothetical protein